MKRHSREWTLRYRVKYIARRMRIRKFNSWGDGFIDLYLEQPGRMSKYNLSCSCEMCKMSRQHKPDVKRRKKWLLTTD